MVTGPFRLSHCGFVSRDEEGGGGGWEGGHLMAKVEGVTEHEGEEEEEGREGAGRTSHRHLSTT